MNTGFQPIDPDNWERKLYFDYYMKQIKSKYTLTVQMDITHLLQVVKARGLRFFPTYLYAIMRGVNQYKAFKMGYDKDGRLGYWDVLHPSYTLFHPDDQTFSDVWSEYDDCFDVFYQRVNTDMEQYKDVKGIVAKPHVPPNFCSVSSMPWLSFSGFAQDTHEPSDLLTPLIRFGKYYEEHNRTRIPFAIFVNHAVADGYHTSQLINEIAALVANTEDWMG